MSTSNYALVSVILTGILLATVSFLKDHFHDPGPYIEKISVLEEEVERRELKAELAQLEMNEFKLNVAAHLPNIMKDQREEVYPLRRLASVTQTQEMSRQRLLRAGQVFDKGKTLFRQKEYEAASKYFKRIIKDFSYSVHLNEAYFLLVESRFQQKEFDSCVRLINEMVTQFPETELTGFALLRLGKIYEFQDRPEEAIQIYQTILKSFPYRGVAGQARNSLQGVRL